VSNPRDQTLLGLVPWRPQNGSAAARCLDDVLRVLDEWVGSAVLPSLTTRAILYRLLPLGWVKSDEDHPLGYVLERARRAGIIPFEWIADGRSQDHVPFSWSGPEEFRAAWRHHAAHYRLDRLRGQPAVELWVETAGMVDMLRALSDELGAPIRCSSGMNTIGKKHEAAQRLAEDAERGNVIVFVGDFDPWGEVRYQNVRDDVLALGRDLHGVSVDCQFTTAALTREQVDEHKIPTEPAKCAERKGKKIPLPVGWGEGDPTAQAEALRPDLLVDAIRTAVMQFIDENVLQETRELERQHRAELLMEIES
jgi:hypothetical protein